MPSRPPPSIDEAFIARHFRKEAGARVDDAELSKLESAVKSAREAAERAFDAADKIAANKLRTPAQNAMRTRSSAWGARVIPTRASAT